MKRKNRVRLTAEQMIKKLEENETDFLELEKDADEEIEEMNVTGAVAGYSTPGAFASPKETDDDHLKKALKKTGSGYIAADNSKPNTYKVWEMKSLGEATYRQYVKDEAMTSHGKVNTAIHQMNSKLFEIEKIVRQSVRLKNEAGINKDTYWKSTQAKLGKIRERVMKLAVEIQKFGE